MLSFHVDSFWPDKKDESGINYRYFEPLLCKPWCTNDLHKSLCIFFNLVDGSSGLGSLFCSELPNSTPQKRLRTELHLMNSDYFWQAESTEQEQEKQTILRISTRFVTLNLLGWIHLGFFTRQLISGISSATRGQNNIWCRFIVAAMVFPAICGLLACPCAAALLGFPWIAGAKL